MIWNPALSELAMVILVILTLYEKWERIRLQFSAHIGDGIPEGTSSILCTLTSNFNIKCLRINTILIKALELLSAQYLEYLPKYRGFSFMIYLSGALEIECLSSLDPNIWLAAIPWQHFNHLVDNLFSCLRKYFVFNEDHILIPPNLFLDRRTSHSSLADCVHETSEIF